MNTLCEISIQYSPNIKNSDRAIIKGSEEVYRLMKSDWTEINIRESMKVLFLNQANKVLGVYELSKGGISSTVVDIRLLFAAALKSLTCAIIIVHNHPSGNLKPSEADTKITRKICEAGKTLDIKILDHLIISDESFFSYADNGII